MCQCLLSVRRHLARLPMRNILFRRQLSSQSHNILAHDVLGPSSSSGATSSPSMLIMHGILGSGLNFRTFARRVSREYPEATVVLVDLRGHGESVPSPPPASPAAGHTLTDCADDVRRLIDHLEIARPSIVCGHSFGGKVALAMYAAALMRNNGDAAATAASAYWVLDSQPCALGKMPLDRNSSDDPNSVAGVIAACRSLSPPFESKQALMSSLELQGVAPAIQSWMTTNVRRTEDRSRLEWRFDLEVISDLFADYGRHNLWPLIQAPTREQQSEVHLVRALRNSVWKQPEVLADVARAEAENEKFFSHSIDAGHWVHAEKPGELYEMMKANSFRLLEK